ncbi:Vacuolar protein sorting-associated protein 22-like protein 1 [Wallemia ichthyophaga EXF-994]|uniref:Vacuolar protein sorting-associated protein 22-like protein 1 n=1 Tax=Wallemia ichthyophaga (strain EXF-994 / CBS 113033) TaxID=1299270 RepID=R9ANY1_WALI9|nr:Vacuolar protein sorting-associated protein 22-like protein 1 [Wallemia ichthyophaga EXF-994]EOR01791.1 Vacuolar protein sorting-associated protein 22-like protein 1 [Wallemia ichthyophaga EXF-994]
MSRRNNKGIGSLHQQHHQNNDAYRSLGNSINAQQLQSIHHQISTFKQYLTDFSKNHRKDIESNVQFRNRFTEMCSTIDVDPLNISRGSLFSNLTGFSDFYLSLAVQLVDMCVSTATLTGGLVRVEDILNALSLKRKTQITLSDLQKSIKVLAPLHDNRHQYEIIPVNQILYMRSQPKELNNDMLSLLSLAHSNHGWIDQSLVQNAQSWTVERVRNSLRQAVMDDGILWIDNQAPQSRYYFPSLFQDIVQSLV